MQCCKNCVVVFLVFLFLALIKKYEICMYVYHIFSDQYKFFWHSLKIFFVCCRFLFHSYYRIRTHIVYRKKMVNTRIIKSDSCILSKKLLPKWYVFQHGVKTRALVLTINRASIFFCSSCKTMKGVKLDV